jgi:hypothetical protein
MLNQLVGRTTKLQTAGNSLKNKKRNGREVSGRKVEEIIKYTNK